MSGKLKPMNSYWVYDYNLSFVGPIEGTGVESALVMAQIRYSRSIGFMIMPVVKGKKSPTYNYNEVFGGY